MTLDDFRTQAVFNPQEGEEGGQGDGSQGGRSGRRPFLGMTPAQRFLVAAMLLFITCLLGTFTLMMMEKVVLPTGLF